MYAFCRTCVLGFFISNYYLFFVGICILLELYIVCVLYRYKQIATFVPTSHLKMRWFNLKTQQVIYSSILHFNFIVHNNCRQWNAYALRFSFTKSAIISICMDVPTTRIKYVSTCVSLHSWHVWALYIKSSPVVQLQNTCRTRLAGNT